MQSEEAWKRKPLLILGIFGTNSLFEIFTPSVFPFSSFNRSLPSADYRERERGRETLQTPRLLRQ